MVFLLLFVSLPSLDPSGIDYLPTLPIEDSILQELSSEIYFGACDGQGPRADERYFTP